MNVSFVNNDDRYVHLVQSSIGITGQVAQLVQGSLLFPHIPVKALCQRIKPVCDLILRESITTSIFNPISCYSTTSIYVYSNSMVGCSFHTWAQIEGMG